MQGYIWFLPMPKRMLAIKQAGGWPTTFIEVLLDQTVWTIVINIAHFISVGALSGACAACAAMRACPALHKLPRPAVPSLPPASRLNVMPSVHRWPIDMYDIQLLSGL